LQFVAGFDSFGPVSIHPAFGYYVGFLVSAAMTYFAFLNFKASGEELPQMPSQTATPPSTPPST
jgi:hypothetical protein